MHNGTTEYYNAKQNMGHRLRELARGGQNVVCIPALLTSPANVVNVVAAAITITPCKVPRHPILDLYQIGGLGIRESNFLVNFE